MGCLCLLLSACMIVFYSVLACSLEPIFVWYCYHHHISIVHFAIHYHHPSSSNIHQSVQTVTIHEINSNRTILTEACRFLWQDYTEGMQFWEVY